MNPLRPDLYALIALPVFCGLDVRDSADMRAGLAGHHRLQLLVKGLMNEGDRNRSFANG